MELVCGGKKRERQLDSVERLSTGAIFTMITTTNANKFRYPSRLSYPPQSRMFTVEMRDSKGQPAKKSSLGEKQAKRLPSVVKGREWKSWLPYHQNEPIQALSFKIDEYFVITKQDEYELEVGVRLLQELPNNAGLRPVLLLPAKIKFWLEPAL